MPAGHMADCHGPKSAGSKHLPPLLPGFDAIPNCFPVPVGFPTVSRPHILKNTIHVFNVSSECKLKLESLTFFHTVTKVYLFQDLDFISIYIYIYICLQCLTCPFFFPICSSWQHQVSYMIKIETYNRHTATNTRFLQSNKCLFSLEK